MQSRRIFTLLTGILIIGALGTTLWKCRYGFDPMDDAFSLPYGFKLFALGDRPIIDEIRNSPRQHDILNYFLVRPFLPFSVLALRFAAVLFYAGLLLGFGYAVSRKKPSLAFGAAFVALLGFDLLASPSWSYDHWCRNLAIVAAILLYIAERTPSRGRQIGFQIGAGVATGWMVLSYLPLVAVLPVLWLAFFAAGKRNVKTSASQWIGFHALGFFLSLTPYFIYLAQPEVQAAWWAHLKTMASEPWYRHNSSLYKAQLLLGYLTTRTELWGMLALCGWTFWKKSLNPQLAFLVGLGLCANTIFRANLSVNHLHLWVLSALISLGLIGAIILMIEGWKQKTVADLAVPAAVFVGMFVMGMSSEGANGALLWLAPVAIVPFLARFDAPTTPVSAKRVVTLFLLLIAGGSLHHQVTRTYADVNVKDCVQPIAVAPLEGIYTSARKARLYEALFSIASGRKFLLAYDAIPAIFLFGSARSAVDTISLIQAVPLEAHQNSIQRMIAERRFPQAIVRLKMHPRTWGMEQIPLRYSKTNPYEKFTECTQGRAIVTLPEFDAVEVESRRVELCARRHFLSLPNSSERDISSVH